MPEPAPAPAAPKGQALKKIAGFELIEKVGQGGMGAVFKARQLSLDRIVALKVLPPSIAKNKEFIERFMREARAAGRLNHPNIVQGIDVGLCDKTNLYFFAMEFIDGPPLGRALKESGAFPEKTVRDVARQIGEALEYASQNGIVHRDIKPDNILMNSQGVAKLADLGLAKQLEKQEDASLTQAGMALGTPFYMSPEQIRGQLDQVDIRTDLYCLGATLFHLVTGQPPYQGATSAVIMAAHLNDKVPLAHQVKPGVSEGFSRLLYALMQKEKNRRPIDPKVFLEMLERVDDLGGTPKRAGRAIRGTTGPSEVIRSTTGARERIRPTTGPREGVGAADAADAQENVPPKSHSLLFFVVGLVAVVLVGGGVLMLTMGRKDEPEKVAVKAEEPKSVPNPDQAPVPVRAPPAKPAWNAASEFENARKFAEGNPDDLRGVLRQYERLLDDAKREKADAAWLEKITAARDEAKARYAAQTAKVWAELQGKIKEARDKGQFDAALQAIADMPRADDEERTRLKELADGLCKEAEEKLNPLLQRAKTALDEGRLDDADARLKETETVGYQPLAEQIAGLRTQVAEARAEKERRAAEAARKAADEGWQKVLAEFDAAVMEKSDLEMVRVILKTAGEDRKLDLRKNDLVLLNDVGTKYLELVERDRKVLSDLTGRNVEWTVEGKLVKGRIKVAKDDVIELFVTFDRVEMVRKIKVADLSEEDRAKLRPALKPQGPVELMAAALTKLKKGFEDRKAAAKFIEGAGDSILALHYRDLLREERGDPGELAAEKAWRAIAAKAAAERLTDKQAEDLRKMLEDFKQSYGATQFATDHQRDINLVTEKVAPPEETDSIVANMIVLHNVYGSTSSSSTVHYGTIKAEITLFLKDKAVAHIPEFKVNWRMGVSETTEVPLGNVTFDRLQVFVTNWTGNSGGFCEIQVFKGKENLALGRATRASESLAGCLPSLATDGKLSTGTTAVGWMPGRVKAWIELDFSKPLPKPIPPGGAAKPATPGGAGAGAPGTQGSWQTPMGGTLRVEEGCATLQGPGEGPAGGAFAVYQQDPGTSYEVRGQFLRKGPYGGFMLGYDAATQKFISFYSLENKGVDMYINTGAQREVWKTIPEMLVPEGEWVPFRIVVRDRDISVELAGKSQGFKLPEKWPAGRQLGLVAHYASTARVKDVSVIPAEGRGAQGASADGNLLAEGTESRSRQGNLHGSILGGKTVVTYDGKAAVEDWYAVDVKQPVTIQRIVFQHGKTFHDGGWFDASAGKPRVQVQAAQGGEWKTVGELTDYPATTATSSAKLVGGACFTCALAAPVQAVAVRVVGKPAQGDSPRQAFSSCGGLSAFGK